MSSRPTAPLDETVVRNLLRQEAETVAPRTDALARLLAAIDAQEGRNQRARGLQGMFRGLTEHLHSRGTRLALALATALLVLLLGTVGRPVAAAVAGEMRDAARTVVSRVREIDGGKRQTPTPTPIATASRAPAPTVTQAPAAATMYRDPAGRFSFLIPAGWSVQQSSVAGVVVTVASGTPRGSANVATETISGTRTLDEYTAATIATIQRDHPGYRVATAGIQPTTLGAYPARCYDVVDGSGGAAPHFVQYVTLVGTQAYVLTLTFADSDSTSFLQQAQMLINTFTFGTAT